MRYQKLGGVFRKLLNINPLLFAILFSWAFLLDMLERNGRLISPSDMLLLFIYGCIILSLQYFIVRKIIPYFRYINIYYAIITLLFISNLLGFYLLNYSRYIQASLFGQIITLLVVGGLFYLIVKYSEKWVFLITLLLAYSLFFSSATSGTTRILDNIIGKKSTEAHVADNIDGEADIIGDTQFVSLPKNYMPQDFTKKPNIYLLSFDAMIPKNIAQKLLTLSPKETPRYFDVLKKNKMQIIPNSFTYRRGTISSFSSMLAIDTDWYNKLYGDVKAPAADMVNGAQWTPTYDIFDRNGYDLQLVYITDYFRSPLGDDNNKVAYWYKTGGEGFCAHLDNHYSLWGYCALKSFIVKAINADSNIGNIYHDRLLAAAQSEQPTFTLAYTFLPGHTSASHNGNNLKDLNHYKKQFLYASVRAEIWLQRYINVIRKYDKDGIIIVFGDHGAHITQGADGIGVNNNYSETDIIQDRHAVLLAVLDPHANTPESCQIAEPVVTTLPDMMHNLITCLTGGKPVLKQRDNSEADFSDYLYDPVQ
ncbi:MAG: hypothetical protein K0U39_10195 [Alphaproteobacteria bacterium]|nr:hypothetical protein [Alphaproteobacteria bacterium]